MNKKDQSKKQKDDASASNGGSQTIKDPSDKFSLGYQNSIWQKEPASWEEILEAIFPYPDISHNLLIPVTSDSFEELDFSDSLPFDPDNIRSFMRESDEHSAYRHEVPKLIKEKVVRVHAKFEDFDLIEVSICIDEGYHGDSDGFGVEPSVWILTWLNKQGKFLKPFSLSGNRSNRNFCNLMTFGINPIDENGEVKKCPFDKVEKCFHLSGYFVVRIKEDYGFADRNMNIVIPLDFKMVHDNEDGLIWIRRHDNLCGIMDLQNQYVIPPVYDYLSFSKSVDGKSFYNAVLNGEKMILEIG